VYRQYVLFQYIQHMLFNWAVVNKTTQGNESEQMCLRKCIVLTRLVLKELPSAV